MSNFTITLKHKVSGEIHKVAAIDNYFGRRVYGYRLPDGDICNADKLYELYEPINQQIGS